MNNVISIIIFRFLFLVLFQIFALNNIQLFGYVNPYLYVLFILTLPLDTPKWLLLVLGFFMGYVIDYFSHTVGLHISATLLIAYLRPTFIQIIIPKLEPGPDIKISIEQIGFKAFFLYTSILVLIHHLCLFYLEIFKLSDFFNTLNRAILSSLLTIILIINSWML